MPTTILTLRLDEQSQAFFERLRQQHYPPTLNQIPAHLTLFHTLPPADETIPALATIAAAQPSFPLDVTGLRSLGRGVAYTLRSAEAQTLHHALAEVFAAELTAQDRQRFQPHVVVQNKSTPEIARSLLAALERTFVPFAVEAVGLDVWDYLGGPWHLAAHLPFQSVSR